MQSIQEEEIHLEGWEVEPGIKKKSNGQHYKTLSFSAPKLVEKDRSLEQLSV